MSKSKEPLAPLVHGPNGDLVSLRRAPANVTSLPMAPKELEPELRRGSWIVFNFPVWSVPDRRHIPEVMRLAKRLGRSVRFGIRPYDSEAEFASWCPGAPTGPMSPIWVVLENGRLVDSVVGYLGAPGVADHLQPPQLREAL